MVEIDADELAALRALSLGTLRRMWDEDDYRPPLSSTFCMGFVHGCHMTAPRIDRDYCGPLFSRAETLAYLKGFGVGRYPAGDARLTGE